MHVEALKQPSPCCTGRIGRRASIRSLSPEGRVVSFRVPSLRLRPNRTYDGPGEEAWLQTKTGG